MFLELKGAFPSIIPQLLMEDLRNLGASKLIAKFIYYSYSIYYSIHTSCKNIFFNINGELIGPRVSTMGLPQGCILSHMLYSVYTWREENAAVMCAGRSRAVTLRKFSTGHSSASSLRSQNVRAHISASRRAYTVWTKQSCVRTNAGFVQTQHHCAHALLCFVLNISCVCAAPSDSLVFQQKTFGPYCYEFLSYNFRRTAALPACRPTLTCSCM